MAEENGAERLGSKIQDIHLLDVDEQMALLIQQVAGQQYGDLYMPVAAGMGCSYNPYKWMEHLNPEAGMLRMVMGLGTRAVERTPGDYPPSYRS